MCSSMRACLSSLVISFKDLYVPANSPSSFNKESLILASRANRCYNNHFHIRHVPHTATNRTLASRVSLDAIGNPFTVRPTRTRVETMRSAKLAGKSSNFSGSPKSWIDFRVPTLTLWYSAMTGWKSDANLSYTSGSFNRTFLIPILVWSIFQQNLPGAYNPTLESGFSKADLALN